MLGGGNGGGGITSLLLSFGVQVSSTADSFRSALLQTGIPLDEGRLAEIVVAVLPREETMAQGSWNLDVIAEVFSQDYRQFNWALVAQRLDQPNLLIRTEADFRLLIKFYTRISNTIFPGAALMGIWNNRPAQLVLLVLASNAQQARIVDFTSLFQAEQRIPDVPVPQNLAWCCLIFYNTLLELAGRGHQNEVVATMLDASEAYPEYVTVLLAQAQDPNSGVRAEVLRRCLPKFTGLVGSRNTSIIVMKRLQVVNPDLLVLLFRMAFKRSTTVQDIMERNAILQSTGPTIFRRLEEEGQPDELLGFWCVQADRTDFSLEDKAVAALNANPSLAPAFLLFVKQHIRTLRQRNEEGGLLSFDNFRILITALQAFPTLVPIEELRPLVQIFQQYQHAATANPGLASGQQGQGQGQGQHQMQSRLVPGVGGSMGEDMGQGQGQGQGQQQAATFMDDVDEEANMYYQRIYKSEISIPDILQLLKQFKSSSETREQEVFRCMIHNLFDEYRFFHKYPDNYLQITGTLFGSLIKHQLISSITSGIALRYVLEALRKDPEQGGGAEKMFRFGRIALEQFRSRLGEWPQYCSHLMQIQHFARHCPQLFDDAQRAINSPGASVPPLGNNGQPDFSSPAFSVQSNNGGGGGGGNSSNLAASAFVNSNSSGLGSGTGNAGGGNTTNGNVAAAFGTSAPPVRSTSAPVPSLSQQMGSLSVLPSERSNSLEGPGTYSAAASAVSYPVLPSMTSLLSLQPTQAEVEEQNLKSPRNNRPSAIDLMVSVNVEATNPAVPPESTKDKIAFIINNVAQSNYEAQVSKLRELLLPEFYVWFANYLVTKRVSQQPNLHGLYLLVLEGLDSHALFKDILDSTYFNVTKLLQSPNITASSSERSLLRNLGIWLGQVTLGRNKPILQRRINLKELLFWGYETGRLIAVCSFVAKIIEGVRDSKVFRPPNPWLMAVLGVMRDLYEVEELKMNIKFEVQVLCKSVNIRIEDIPRTSSLAQLRMPNKDRNPDFTVKGAPAASTSSLATSLPQGISFPATLGKEEEKGADRGLSEQPVIPNLAAFVVVNPSLQFFAQNPAHRRVVSLAIDRAIREVIQPVVDRSAQVACVSTKQVVLKDFSNEGNEQHLRNAAHLMASQLAGGLAIVTCKEPLRVSIVTQLRSLLAQVNVTDATVMEQILQVCSMENLDLGCALIEKAAMEKAIRDIDEALQASYQARRKAREGGVQFADANIVRQAGAKFPRELPEALKSRPTGLLPHQLQVYDGFQRQRAQALAASQASSGQLDSGSAAAAAAAAADKSASGAVMLSLQQAVEAYNIILQRIEMALKSVQLHAQGRDISISMLPGDHEILSLLRDMIIVTQRTQLAVRVDAALSFAEIIFKRMVENVSVPDVLRLEVLVGSLEALRDACGGQKKFAPDMSSWLNRYSAFNSNDEISRKMHRAILLLLLRAKLIRSQDIDVYLATLMDTGRNMIWVELALSFVRQCLAEGVAATQEFANTFDTVSKMRPANAAVRKQLQKWLTDLRALSATKDEQKAAAVAASSATPTGTLAARDSSVREHVTVLLERWLRVWPSTANEAVFAQYLHMMHQFGVLKTEEAADRFFRVATELCVEACLKSAQQPAPAAPDAPPAALTLTFTVIDALSKLFLLLVRLADKEVGDVAARANLLARILNAVVRTLIEDHESKKSKREIFDQRPYFRLLSNLAQDLRSPAGADSTQEPSPGVIALLATYSQAFNMLVPTTVPGFAFAWLQLISSRSFMPQLLLVKQQKGWPYMHRLLMSLLLFLQPFLKTVQLTDAVRKLYKGTLRVLLVILHDFPEFLAEYHLSFCDVIPSTCVQLRNLVLSAFPKSMRLPDPFTPNLKIDAIPEIVLAPRISSDSLSILSSIKPRLDLFLQTRQPPEFPSLLPQVLVQNGTYNLPLLNALVITLGAQGVSQLQSSAAVPLENTASMDIFKYLSSTLDAEGRYHLVSAMANQLRYPNSHTRYFSMVVLLLFAEADSEFLQEQITRVLLERLIVHRPHPWGLLITFIELLKNPRYAFWRRNFTRGVPEIERVFETVARSLSGPAAAQAEGAESLSNAQSAN